MPLNVSPSEKQELATTLAALILYDDKANITPENINKILAASNVQVEPYWPKLFATLLEGKDVGSLLLSGGGGGGGAPAAGGAAPAAAAAAGGKADKADDKKEEKGGKKKEKEKEKSEESEADMGFSLFD